MGLPERITECQDDAKQQETSSPRQKLLCRDMDDTPGDQRLFFALRDMHPQKFKSDQPAQMPNDGCHAINENAQAPGEDDAELIEQGWKHGGQD